MVTENEISCLAGEFENEISRGGGEIDNLRDCFGSRNGDSGGLECKGGGGRSLVGEESLISFC